MSACIYHDSEAVAVCPGCDFGVCQECMDGGTEGVCSTCAEERDMRRQHSALQREYTVEEAVARCHYCRAAADEETPLDEHGYCPTCTTLARCCLHDDLIAVGHCKSCRKEYCRKCLGFTDVCQSCTAKNKSRPKTAPPPPPPARSGKKKTLGTTPIKEPAAKSGAAVTGRLKEGTRRKSEASGPLKTEAAVGKGGKKKGTEELDEKGRKKPKPPSRGTLAMEARLAAKAPARKRSHLVIAAVAVVAVVVIGLGSTMGKVSADDQSRKINDQMVSVHRAILHFYKANGKLPNSSDQVYRALADIGVHNARSIRLASKPQGRVMRSGEPDSVVIDLTNSTFTVMGTDKTGTLIKDPHGAPVFLDQTFDSGNAQ